MTVATKVERFDAMRASLRPTLKVALASGGLAGVCMILSAFGAIGALGPCGPSTPLGAVVVIILVFCVPIFLVALLGTAMLYLFNLTQPKLKRFD